MKRKTITNPLSKTVLRGCYLLFLALFSTGLTAQITVDVSNKSIKEILKEIETKSEYRFFYNEGLKDLDKTTSLRVKDASIDKTMLILLEKTEINYKLDKNNLVILVAKIKTSQSQSKKITGLVTDEKGEPIIGASVMLKGEKTGTITNSNGEFSIESNDNKALLVSYIGFLPQEVITKSNQKIVMIEKNQMLDEIVVVGYGTQKKASLTGSVSVIKMADIANTNSTTGNVMKSLQGRIPGVQVFGGGDPNGGATIRIRGTGTFGNNDPLYIIDGVPTKRSLNEISPADIESIQVMKDASAASIYGSRAASGVIIITTKKAKLGTKVEVASTLTAQTYINPVKLLNTEQRGLIQWRAYRNDGLDPNFSAYSFDDHIDNNGNYILDRIKLPEFLDPEKTMRPADTDWANVLSRTGLTQNYNVSITNGTQKGSTLFSVDYFDNKGTIVGSRWTRTSLRLNSDYKLFNNHLTVGENFLMTKLSYRGNINSGIINAARYIQPVVPVYTINRGYGGPAPGMTDHAYNLVRIVDTNKDNGNDAIRMLGSGFLDLEILKDFHFRSNLALDYVGFWQRYMQVPYKEGYVNSTASKVVNDANYSGNWTFNNTLTYNLNLKNHQIDLMAGQEMMSYSINTIQASREQFASFDPNYMYINTGEVNPQNSGGSSANSLMSYFGRINYAYNNRYLLSATIRRDGSSRFGSNNKFGTFPAFSTGWKLSEEEFIKKSVPFLSDLKIRYGWGMTGNQEIGDYATASIYSSTYATDPTWLDSYSADQGTAYDIHGTGTGQLPSGYVRTQQPNPNLKWETATQSNLGLDFGFLNQKISGSLDVFKKTTEDILVRPPALAVIGEGGSPWVNGATIENTGFDFMLSYNEKIGQVGLSVSANISHYLNVITKLPAGVEASFAGNGNDQTILNRPWGSQYGLIADGIFQNQAEVDAHAIQTGKGIGRLQYRDVNGDGKIDNDDRTWIGSTDPNLLCGLNIQLDWKTFDFSMFWRGVFGQDVQNWTKRFTDFYAVDDPTENKGLRTLNAWTPQNNTSTIPALSTMNNNGEDRFSTYYLENGSFAKLDNLEFGYSFPDKLLKQLFINKARIFIMGQNLILIKSKTYTGSDPESPNSAYPSPTSYSFGINVTF